MSIGLGRTATPRSIASPRKGPQPARRAKRRTWTKETRTPSPGIQAHKASGKTAAVKFAAKLGRKAETARELCYRFCVYHYFALRAIPKSNKIRSFWAMTDP